MIKIKRYYELPEGEKVFNLYLFMAAMSMPFYPEDIFPDGFYYPDGITKTELKSFPRSPRRRTKKYADLLTKKRMHFSSSLSSLSSTTFEPAEEDALLAEVLIKDYSTELHDFLYDGQTDGHVDPDALRILLTTPVDNDSLKRYPKLFKVFANAGSYKESSLLLENVFRYEAFTARAEIHTFVQSLGVDICPYCNRLYITTALRTKSASPVRPELDHYRSKSKYPFFALSILNLVPSCSVCNHIKSDNEEELLYPYGEGLDNDYMFQTEPTGGIIYLSGTRIPKEDFLISLKQKNLHMDPEKEERVKNSINTLQLDSMYNAHREYVSDIMFQRYVFDDPMIQDLVRQFPGLFKDETEVRNMLLLMDISPSKWGNRPLSKLTHDISEELDELYEAADSE